MESLELDECWNSIFFNVLHILECMYCSHKAMLVFVVHEDMTVWTLSPQSSVSVKLLAVFNSFYGTNANCHRPNVVHSW